MLLYQPKVNSFFLYPSYVPFSKPKPKPKSKPIYIIHFYTFRFLFVFVTYSNFLEHTLILTDFTQQVQFTISITDCLTLCLFLLLFTVSFGIVWYCLALFGIVCFYFLIFFHNCFVCPLPTARFPERLEKVRHKWSKKNKQEQ